LDRHLLRQATTTTARQLASLQSLTVSRLLLLQILGKTIAAVEDSVILMHLEEEEEHPHHQQQQLLVLQLLNLLHLVFRVST